MSTSQTDASVRSLLNPIRFNKDFKYSRTVPTLACNSVSGFSEIARWVLDKNEILYIEDIHAPRIYLKKVNKLTGTNGVGNAPAHITTDSLVYTAESIIQYYDARIPANKRLIPDDSVRQKEVMELYHTFVDDLNGFVWQYLYLQLLRSRKHAKKLFKRGVPFMDRLKYTFFYGSYKRALIDQWDIKDKEPIEFLIEIKKILSKVDDILSDGRKYLTGDKISAADIAFASIMAPILIPDEFGGSIVEINQISEELREEVYDLRATTAGQFVLGIYIEDRPINLDLGAIPKKPNFIKRALTRFLIKLTSNQAGVFYMLQKRFPIIKLNLLKIAVVSRHDLVVDVLERNNDFTVEEINAKKMSNQKGAFFLGMDRVNPQFDRERNYVRKTTHKDDLDMIRKYVRETADGVLNQVQPFGKMDVVQTLNYTVLIGLIGHYFGVPAPVESSMKRWQRSMFYDLFLNFTNNEAKHKLAVDSGKQRTTWVRSLITKHRKAIAKGEEIEDNLLTRLILLAENKEEYGWVDDDVIRRNIGGLLTGIQETTSKAVIFSLQELFKRPDQLKGAIAASKAYDMDSVRGYVYEAMRFNPVQPGVLRFNETKQIINGKKKDYTIKGNRKMMVLTSGAMFDPENFPDPKKFDAQRGSRYMNWGFGMHECYGKYINSVTIPELVAAVLRLENVRLAKGRVARGAGLKEGPFPNNYLVEFDSK
jgi:cytochrome P450/glutathione S-transferase